MDQDKLLNSLVDAYERAEEADEALQEFYPELGQVLCLDIMERFDEALQQIGLIQTIVLNAVGGHDKLMRLQYERDPDAKD